MYWQVWVEQDNWLASSRESEEEAREGKLFNWLILTFSPHPYALCLH